MQAERRQEKDFRRHAPGIRLDLLTFACKGFHVLCPVDVPWSHIASISVTYRLLGVLGIQPVSVRFCWARHTVTGRSLCTASAL